MKIIKNVELMEGDILPENIIHLRETSDGSGHKMLSVWYY